uniref:Uncharacterized protein n=1 Tax=Anguilla anguilla TaxID=7936 RepID=A0A0E9T9M1_ANGAN
MNRQSTTLVKCP